MGGRRSGSGLMVAGAIVIVIGFGVALIKAWNLPNYWIPVVVGIGLVVIGAIRWATSKGASGGRAPTGGGGGAARSALLHGALPGRRAGGPAASGDPGAGGGPLVRLPRNHAGAGRRGHGRLPLRLGLLLGRGGVDVLVPRGRLAPHRAPGGARLSPPGRAGVRLGRR